MDLNEVIHELRVEKERLDEIIATLERLRSLDLNPTAPRRRGRKFMDTQARQEVSERMKNYWKARKEKNSQSSAVHAGDTPADTRDRNQAHRAMAAGSNRGLHVII